MPITSHCQQANSTCNTAVISTTPLPLPEHARQRCEVWTRVMGYHRPISEFNPGKQSEHRERSHFIEPTNQTKAHG